MIYHPNIRSSPTNGSPVGTFTARLNFISAYRSISRVHFRPHCPIPTFHRGCLVVFPNTLRYPTSHLEVAKHLRFFAAQIIKTSTCMRIHVGKRSALGSAAMPPWAKSCVLTDQTKSLQAMATIGVLPIIGYCCKELSCSSRGSEPILAQGVYRCLLKMRSCCQHIVNFVGKRSTH